MGRSLSTDGTSVAAAGTFNHQASYGPYGMTKKIDFVVPAGVSTIYATGCAQGGSSPLTTTPPLSPSGDQQVYDGAALVGLACGSYNYSAIARTILGHSNSRYNSNDADIGAVQDRFMGKTLSAAESGPSFIVSGGSSSSGATTVGISWSTNSGVSWSTLDSITTTTNSFCRDSAVSNDGKAVIILYCTGTGVALVATSDYGATWTQKTFADMGSTGIYAYATVEYINGQFVLCPQGGNGVVKYATDPTGTWSTASTGESSTVSGVAWNGTTYAFGHANGAIRTCTSLAGAFTARTSNLSSGYTYIVTGGGWFVAYIGTSGAASVSYSTDGTTWVSSTPNSSAQWTNGGACVYNATLGIFVFVATSESYSYRSTTGASWTNLTNALPMSCSLPTANAEMLKSLINVGGVVLCRSSHSLSSATATAWTSSSNYATFGFTIPSYNGAGTTVVGSTSGTLLSLAGGLKAGVASSTGIGGQGGGSVSAGGLGGNGQYVGGSGQGGIGGKSTGTAGDMTIMGTGSAGNGAFLSQAHTGGGGALLLSTLPLNAAWGVYIPGAGGGYSSVSTQYYMGGGGGSAFSRGGNATNLTSSLVTREAEGIGQGGYGSSNGSSQVGGGSGGGEACYRVAMFVTPGETLTLTVPGRGSAYMTSTTNSTSSGGAGFLQLEWNE